MPRLPAPSPSSFSPFAFPVFRAIWIANLASTIGSMVQSVGASWLMTELTPSHQLVALVQASVVIPMLLIGPLAGVIADRHDRRLVMLASQIAMLSASILLTLLTMLDKIGAYSLLACTLAVGCGFALNAPAWQASVRSQVDSAHLPQAITLNTIAFNIGRSVGPALGGVILTLQGPAATFAFNSVSYLAMIAVLLHWRPGFSLPDRGPIRAAVMEGLRFCAASSPLRRIILRGFTFGFGAIGFHALLPSLVRSRMMGTELTFGLSLAAFGVGSILCALFVGEARRRWGTEAVLAASSAAYALGMIPFAMLPASPLVFPGAALAGAGWVAALTTLNVAMQLRSPDAILGRCLSTYQAATFGGMAAGAYVLGLVADVVSLEAATMGSAAWLLLTTLLLRLYAPMPARSEGRIEPA